MSIRSSWSVFGLLAVGIFASQAAVAEDDEEALIRRELERIIAHDPKEAPKARKALDALNQPATTAEEKLRRDGRRNAARRIVNGLPAAGHSAVGALLKGKEARSARAWCTGTLVGCDKFLTAAHCIEEDPTPASYLVFFQELGFFKVSKIAWPKGAYRFPYFDLAMLTLAQPVEGIAPVAINRAGSPLNKRLATIVGFGRTGGDRDDYGIVREGSALTQACSSTYAKQKLLCWKYHADVRARSSPSNTCNGDSGGGVFMLEREEGQRFVHKVFGVVSGGKDETCVRSDESYNVDVFQFRRWITDAGEGRLSPRMCGNPLTEPKPKKSLLPLGDDMPEATIHIAVPPGAVALRAAMNGEDDGRGTNDFDLAVYRPGPLPATQIACEGNGPGQFAFCEISAPEPGDWSIVVRRRKGHGQVQITPTIVRADRP